MICLQNCYRVIFRMVTLHRGTEVRAEAGGALYKTDPGLNCITSTEVCGMSDRL